MEDKPIVIALYEVKAQLSKAITSGLQQGIPACIMESLLCEYVAEVRKMNMDDLAGAYRKEIDDLKASQQVE